MQEKSYLKVNQPITGENGAHLPTHDHPKAAFTYWEKNPGIANMLYAETVESMVLTLR